mmetsp:Transcript_42426/g.98164  ORF Transcript_42426/g.98164 Transcript_42426/m.98164 type:complete len:301 (-) Transcript_42426:924-1826(-)
MSRRLSRRRDHVGNDRVEEHVTHNFIAARIALPHPAGVRRGVVPVARVEVSVAGLRKGARGKALSTSHVKKCHDRLEVFGDLIQCVELLLLIVDHGGVTEHLGSNVHARPQAVVVGIGQNEAVDVAWCGQSTVRYQTVSIMPQGYDPLIHVRLVLEGVPGDPQYSHATVGHRHRAGSVLGRSQEAHLVPTLGRLVARQPSRSVHIPPLGGVGMARGDPGEPSGRTDPHRTDCTAQMMAEGVLGCVNGRRDKSDVSVRQRSILEVVGGPVDTVEDAPVEVQNLQAKRAAHPQPHTRLRAVR